MDADPLHRLSACGHGVLTVKGKRPAGSTVSPLPLIGSSIRRLFLPHRTYENVATKRAIDSGLLPSVGSVDDSYDNAVIEWFWSRMQVELRVHKRWDTRVELATAIFEYLEIFHNRQRRHSALGMLTPTDVATRYRTTTVA